MIFTKKSSVYNFIFVAILSIFYAVLQVGTAHCVEPSNPPETYYVTLEKSVDQNEVILSQGETQTLNYTITVTVSSILPAAGTCYFTLADGQHIYVSDTAVGNIFADTAGGGLTGLIEYSGGEREYDHSYSVEVGPYECNDYVIFENTACLNYNPTGSPDCCATTVVGIRVECGTGCTLTPGYWKTHSEYGPAPYDLTWAQLTNGADTQFFDTGQSYYEVLWSKPKGGNAYYILAHAYIAAELNTLSGASLPSYVAAAWSEAGSLLEAYENESLIPKKTEDRDRAIELAQLLDAYNNGYIGPGHCTD